MNIILYISNKPDLESFKNRRGLKNLKKGDVDLIISKCGNHWRKIFTIFSKICFNFNPITDSWREYRDNILLSNQCIGSISFSKKIIKKSNNIILLSGKESWKLDYLNDENTFRTAYFDYRQFSNLKIDSLITDISSLNI